MPIICTADIATRLGLSPNDNSLVGIAAAVNAAIKTFLRYDPAAEAARLEWYDSGGSTYLPLNHGPVVTESVVVHCIDNWIWGWGTPGAYAQGATDPFDSSNLLVRGTDYAVDTDAGSRGPVLVRLNGVWPISAMRPPNRLAGDLVPALGCVQVAYEVDDGDVLAVSRMYALREAISQYRASGYALGWVTTDSMDGASVSITPFQRNPNYKGADPFLNPSVAPGLLPFRRTLL